MKTASERIQQRLKKDRRMTVISIRIPEGVIEELKEIAPSLGFGFWIGRHEERGLYAAATAPEGN